AGRPTGLPAARPPALAAGGLTPWPASRTPPPARTCRRPRKPARPLSALPPRLPHSGPPGTPRPRPRRRRPRRPAADSPRSARSPAVGTRCRPGRAAPSSLSSAEAAVRSTPSVTTRLATILFVSQAPAGEFTTNPARTRELIQQTILTLGPNA